MKIWNSKTWNKKQEGGFLGAVLQQPVVSSIINAIFGKCQGSGFLPILPLLLMIIFHESSEEKSQKSRKKI